MVKGVHRKAIEILQPEDPCFERAIFFLSPKGELARQVVCFGVGGSGKRNYLGAVVVAGVKRKFSGKLEKGIVFCRGV